MRYYRIAPFLLLILTSACAALAQDRKPLADNEQNQYIVSAKAGVVNTVDGAATIRRFKPFAMPGMLISGDELETGDTVSTGQNAHAEILLSPGCYLRLGENSEFLFLFDGLSNHDRIRLLRGSAIIEASAIDDFIVVEAPKGKFGIARTGLYRFNVAAGGKAEVLVRKGLVLSGRTDIKQGKRGTVDGGAPVIASFDKNEADELDDWSKERARTLIAANKKLSKHGMKGNLAMGFVSNTWIYDPLCRCYTFLPYTAGFASPYGWGYSVCNPYWYRRPGPGFNYGGGSGGGYAGGQTVGGGGNSSGGGGQPAHPSMPPPSVSSPSQSAGSNQDAQPAAGRGGRRP
ncbi:MAG: FecR family protein [Blastocatellia bacterium]